MKRIDRYRCVLVLFFTAVLLVLSSTAFSQSLASNPELQQKVAALKQSVAQNQQALRRYTWTESQEMILKGDTKSTKTSQCQYGPDGKVQKTVISVQPPPKEERGLKGKIIAKKKGEIQDYMERVAQLIERYTPPEASQMQDSMAAGKASITPSGGGIVMLAFHDYAKPGDTVTVTFDTSIKKIRVYAVNTYLDAPEDVVTLNVAFNSLPDGTNYVNQTVLDATAKQVQIRTTSSGFNKL
jgi:hypothetical protein